MLGGILLFLGSAWAVLGFANVLLAVVNPSLTSGWQTFGVIFNMVLFILPGLALAGVGELLRRRRQPKRTAAAVSRIAPQKTIGPSGETDSKREWAIGAATVLIVGAAGFAA